MVMTHKTKEKFQLKWKWPFVVESVYSNRAHRLLTPDGNILMMPINGKYLKKIMFNTTPLIVDTPWPIRWIRVWDLRCLEEHQRRVSSFNGSHHGRSMLSRPNMVDILMYDVNIEETKLETSVLTCHFLMIKLILYLWSKLHPDQWDGLGFEIQDV